MRKKCVVCVRACPFFHCSQYYTHVSLSPEAHAPRTPLSLSMTMGMVKGQRSKVGGWVGGHMKRNTVVLYTPVHGALVACLLVLSDFPLQSSTVSQACQLPQISTTPLQWNPTVETSTEPHTYICNTHNTTPHAWNYLSPHPLPW